MKNFARDITPAFSPSFPSYHLFLRVRNTLFSSFFPSRQAKWKTRLVLPLSFTQRAERVSSSPLSTEKAEEAAFFPFPFLFFSRPARLRCCATFPPSPAMEIMKEGGSGAILLPPFSSSFYPGHRLEIVSPAPCFFSFPPT